MPDSVHHSGLSIHPALYELVNNEIIPGSQVAPDDFWRALAALVTELDAPNQALLAKRADLQTRIDQWHKQYGSDYALPDYKAFLKDIGYLVEPGADFAISTDNVDAEIAVIAGPQLVVPVDNARYALNAANARWNSLYDALYSTDVIASTAGCEKTAEYNPRRAAKVVRYVREFLDNSVPLVEGSHVDAVDYQIRSGELQVRLRDGRDRALKSPRQFVGYTGPSAAPTSILLQRHNLHVELKIGLQNDPEDSHRHSHEYSPAQIQLAQTDAAQIWDVQAEAAITTIMDCEDSVATVDVADKIRVYRNWAGLMRGDLQVDVDKGGRRFVRRLREDREWLSPAGQAYTLPGRSLMFIRHVGTHLYTDAVTLAGQAIPETFLDAMVTLLAAKHDVLHNSRFQNSRKASVYVVKPKMHGPEEVAAAVTLFERVEDALGLARDSVKMGIMDEERRTSVNLKACIRAAQTRVVFINTGFLDRTGDEIHTCMEAAPVLPKNEIKTTTWLLAYEDSNVDIGLAAGLPGRAQIGKGMWAAPDNLAAMMQQKIAHPSAGANTAWVPSPTAATLHALHYHSIDVRAQQQRLASRTPARLDDILRIPALPPQQLTPQQIQADLDNNAQGILGYVVRWVDQGIGCSKVPDLNDTELMEDRATLRISSQHIANWLHHELVTPAQVHAAFEKMAAIVDAQNATDSHYQNLAPHFSGIAYQAALELVFEGRHAANGYTEAILYKHRRAAKG